MGYFFIHLEESDENWKFDKIAGENERSEVQAVAIWKGAHKRSEVGIYNLVTRPIFYEHPFEACFQRGILLKLLDFYLQYKSSNSLISKFAFFQKSSNS